MLSIPEKFFEACQTCDRHTNRTRCCCDYIRDLQKRIDELEKVLDGTERFVKLVTEQSSIKLIDIKNAAQWCESELAFEHLYNAQLENELIESQIENWLAREALQILKIDASLPLREGILELAKRTNRGKDDAGNRERKRKG